MIEQTRQVPPVGETSIVAGEPRGSCCPCVWSLQHSLSFLPNLLAGIPAWVTGKYE